jgi:peptidoglycan hydrolase-like protein with peptidoglycan-binding domain
MAPIVPFPRPLYPPSSVKGPVTDNNDNTAVKRAISRAGFWPWQPFDDSYNEKFAMEGVKNFQKDNGLLATGIYGKATHDKLVATHRKTKPNEWAFDQIAIGLMKLAKEEMTAQNKNIPLETTRQILAFCRTFSGGYLYGGQHDSSFDDDKVTHKFDCSSSTSFVLHKFNLLGVDRAQVSGWFESWGLLGRGKYLTIHATEDHVWMEFSLPEGYFRFDTSPHGDGVSGPRVRTRERSDSRFVHRHPKGM